MCGIALTEVIGRLVEWDPADAAIARKADHGLGDRVLTRRRTVDKLYTANPKPAFAASGAGGCPALLWGGAWDNHR